MRPVILLLPTLLLAADPLAITKVSLADGKAVRAVHDGQTEAGPVWSTREATAVLELDLGRERTLGGLHLFSGNEGRGLVTDVTVEFQDHGTWKAIPSAVVSGNRAKVLGIAFDATVTVTTSRLRLRLGAPAGLTVREIAVFAEGGLPPVAASTDREPPLIYLNQAGFGTDRPKRFTAPTLADGTAFVVRPAAGGAPVATGVINGHRGDFSSCTARGEFVVEAGGLTSVPFVIGPWWLERVTTQGSIDFMIDSRHYLGTWTKPCPGSFGWRDDHHFGWELHALVPQLLANPAVVERLPRQITWQAPTDPKLWGALEAPKADAPDVVKLIHWGADVIVTQGATHEHLKAQLAYFLAAWPVLSRWLPAQNHEVVAAFARRTWGQATADRKYPYDISPSHDLFALKTKMGTTKGELPPGFSVEPNLLMYEVAKREGWPEAERHLTAAVDQAAWMVANLNWSDPLVTKGQRMSEFLTMTGLGHLLASYPDRAPKGLRESIAAWAAVVIRRSDNLWDFRKLDDGDRWTPTGEKPTQWNEPGNVVGLPAAIFAALPHLTDPAQRARLETIAHAHFDDALGRNPAGRCFDYRGPEDIEGVEFGGYSRLPGGIGQLAKARFVLDGSPKNQLYPYHPEVGNIGWTEGWVQFNTPFTTSMAYLARHDSRLELAAKNGRLDVRLRAPVGFNPAVRETATVQVTSATGTTDLVVTEESPESPWLSGNLPLPQGPVTVTYGFDWMATRATLRP